jgi:dihydrodipicolinate synthase/N-acetylneuraminate lyase
LVAAWHTLPQDGSSKAEANESGIARLFDHALATGIRGVTVLGIAGEAHRLTDDERRRVVTATVKAIGGRVPVVVGVSASGLHLAPRSRGWRARRARLGGVYFFEELSRGADGAMTGFPYPEALREIRDAFVAGQRATARALFYRWLPLIRYESQPGAVPGTSLAIRKELLRRRGWLATSYVRPPAAALDPATLDELTEIMATLST